eukprot:5993728-Amphidinium_carterae.1
MLTKQNSLHCDAVHLTQMAMLGVGCAALRRYASPHCCRNSMCAFWINCMTACHHLPQRVQQISPNMVSYSSVIRACERGHAWQ